MATDHTQEILKHLQRLSADDQAEILREIQRRARPGNGSHVVRSILELEGLGREIWQDIDAQAYVRSERDSWSG